MATHNEFNALYRTGKQLEAREEGLGGTTDFYEILAKALAEAKTERGKIEMDFDHHDRVFIRVYGRLLRGGCEHAQLRREYTHYL